MTTTYNQPSVIIIENGTAEGEDRIIGPFPSGDEANDWAFKHLPYGVQWHWLPIDAPTTMGSAKAR